MAREVKTKTCMHYNSNHFLFIGILEKTLILSRWKHHRDNLDHQK